jgi:hypothetical protein
LNDRTRQWSFVADDERALAAGFVLLQAPGVTAGHMAFAVLFLSRLLLLY